MKRFTVLFLVVSSVSLSLASPASAALDKCAGHAVTHRGTPTNDIIYGTAGADVINAGRGADIIYGLGGDDIICGGRGKDTIHGGPGDDYIRGGNARDRIYGNAGNDVLQGNIGQDTLNGGPGNDSCTTFVNVSRCESYIAVPPPSPSTATGATPVATGDVTPEATMIARINQVRAAAGVAPLAAHSGVAVVAENWSTRMANEQFFHHNPNYGQEYPGQPWAWGENIAYAFGSDPAYPQSLLEASPGHYANMVNPNYTHVGVGIVFHNGYVYVTQNFARYQ